MDSGEIFGRYQILGRLAMGGMGEVSLARYRGAEGEERQVALKRILPQLTRDPDFVAYFLREGRIALLFNHPNVVHTYEMGRVGEQYYIAMEYVPGSTLVQLLAAGVHQGNRISVPVALHIATGIARALDHVHRQSDSRGRSLGLIHMDLAPHNILISDSGDPKLFDFGIAFSSGRGPREPRRRDLRGRTAYLAPEQIDDLKPDQRLDLFALGVIMHEMVLGKPLFRARHESATVTRILHARVPNPAARVPECPQAFADIILRALARDRDDRFQSADELLAALERCAAEHDLLTTGGERRQALELLAMPRQMRAEIARQETPSDVEGRRFGVDKSTLR